MELIKCAALGDTKRLQFLIHTQGCDVNGTDKYGDWTPLIKAASWEQYEIMKILLDNGAFVNKTNRYRDTALHMASQQGFIQGIQLLLNKGASLVMVNEHFCTPLMYAVFYGQLDAVELLLEKGSLVNLIDCHGETELMTAVGKSFYSIVEVLLRYKALINLKSTMEETALDIACRLKDLRMVSLLLTHGAKFNKMPLCICDYFLADERWYRRSALLLLLYSIAASNRPLSTFHDDETKNQLFSLTIRQIQIPTVSQFGASLAGNNVPSALNRVLQNADLIVKIVGHM